MIGRAQVTLCIGQAELEILGALELANQEFRAIHKDAPGPAWSA